VTCKFTAAPQKPATSSSLVELEALLVERDELEGAVVVA